MKEINNLEQLSEFKGNFVCFESTPQFSNPNKCYLIEGKKFAYVGEKMKYYSYTGGASGFDFSVLQNMSQTSKIKLIINRGLEKLSLKMRLATEDEVDLIRNAITQSEAQCYTENDTTYDNLLNKEIYSCRF